MHGVKLFWSISGCGQFFNVCMELNCLVPNACTWYRWYNTKKHGSKQYVDWRVTNLLGNKGLNNFASMVGP